jgi:hypothetical protein
MAADDNYRLLLVIDTDWKPWFFVIPIAGPDDDIQLETDSPWHENDS